jgi:hypothetical protein
MPTGSVIICSLLIGLFLLLILPTEKLISKTLGITINRITSPLALLSLAFLALVYFNGFSAILYITLSAFCLFTFTLGFLVNRKYPYTLALIFLVICPLLLSINLAYFARFSATLCYFCLVLGIIKDILYDKIIDKGIND